MGTSSSGAPPAAAVDPAGLLRALFDEAPECVLVTDGAGRVLAANAGAEALTGRPASALAGTPILDLLAPPAPGLAPPRLEELCRAGGEVAARALRREAGPEVDVELSCRRLGDGRLLWVLRDVTERRRREMDVWVRSEALESSINAIALAGLDGRLFYVNRAFLRMWGLSSPVEAVGRPATSFWAEPERAVEVLSRVQEGHGSVGDLVGLRPDGGRFHAELSASLVRDVAGRPVALMGSFIDTTARVRALEALRESEDRLAQAVRVAGIGIFDFDLRAGTLHWSARQREIHGVGPEEPVDMARLMRCLPPEDRGIVEEAEERATAPHGDGRFDSEHRVAWPDGSIRWVTSRGQAFFEGEGEARRAVRIVGAVRDVTEARRAEVEAERLRAQLEHAQRLESVGRLAGGVAHDFNNMLAVILGNAEVIRLRPGLDAELDADLSEIEKAARHARDVTRQLLAFSRKQVVSPRPLDLNQELERTRKTLARLIGEDVALTLHPAPGLWRVALDPLQVDQVLMNLAVNARDAMPGGGRLTVETANVQLDEAYCARHPDFRPGDHVLLAVSDTGAGMDRETLAHLFEPFFTTKGPGQGTGLGLATVYGIVAQAGGTVHVYSEPGHGSTFKLYFPRLRTAGAPAPEADPEPAVPGGGTVLLVEDDDMVRRMAASMLGSLGLSVVPAPGPREALAIAAQGDRAFDLVLTDVVMPEMSGRALRDRLRELRPDVPVLFMSGYTPNVIVHHGVLDEGVRLLQKPFTLGDLAAAVRHALAPARRG